MQYPEHTLKKAIALFLLFTWAPVALAAPSPLTETSSIPGLRSLFSRIIYKNSQDLLVNLGRAFRNRVDMKTPLALEDIQCGLAKLGAGFVQDMMLNPNPDLTPDDIKGLPDALAHYRALEERFCRPPPGASVNRGAELVKLFIIRNTEGTPHAKGIQTKYAKSAVKLESTGGPELTSTQVAMAVAIAIAILAKESVPVVP